METQKIEIIKASELSEYQFKVFQGGGFGECFILLVRNEGSHDDSLERLNILEDYGTL